MAFNCTSCGLCCKNLGRMLRESYIKVPWMRPMVEAFPHKVLEDGSCEMLVDNRCSVYEDRPLMCNIDKMAKHPMPISRLDWYSLNYQGCNTLQMEIR